MSKDNGGMKPLDTLCLIFIVLKVTGLIEWSWFWVLSPLWIYLIILLILKIVLKIMDNFM